MVKNLQCRDPGLIPGLGNNLEKGIATHSNILAWRIAWTEETGGILSMGLQNHDGVTNTNAHLIQTKLLMVEEGPRI